jgi:hypothetical protein
MTTFITKFENDSIHAVTRHTWHVTGVEYHRNGSGGEGFYLVEFHRAVMASEDHRPRAAKLSKDSIVRYLSLRAVVFRTDCHCAVFNPAKADDCYRGDNFERGLREVIKVYEKSL